MSCKLVGQDLREHDCKFSSEGGQILPYLLCFDLSDPQKFPSRADTKFVGLKGAHGNQGACGRCLSCAAWNLAAEPGVARPNASRPENWNRWA